MLSLIPRQSPASAMQSTCACTDTRDIEQNIKAGVWLLEQSHSKTHTRAQLLAHLRTRSLENVFFA